MNQWRNKEGEESVRCIADRPPSIVSGSKPSPLAGGLEVTTRGESWIEVAGLVWNKTAFAVTVTLALLPLLSAFSSQVLMEDSDARAQITR